MRETRDYVRGGEQNTGDWAGARAYVLAALDGVERVEDYYLAARGAYCDVWMVEMDAADRIAR